MSGSPAWRAAGSGAAGRGKPYSDTTIADYRRTYLHYLRPYFGPRTAEEIGEFEWQA